ncbi:MAG: DUF1996 domain-containing protein [Actinomycetota bacterium]
MVMGFRRGILVSCLGAVLALALAAALVPSSPVGAAAGSVVEAESMSDDGRLRTQQFGEASGGAALVVSGRSGIGIATTTYDGREGSGEVRFVFNDGSSTSWAKVYLNGSSKPEATWSLRDTGTVVTKGLTRAWKKGDTIAVKFSNRAAFDYLVVPGADATPPSTPPTPSAGAPAPSSADTEAESMSFDSRLAVVGRSQASGGQALAVASGKNLGVASTPYRGPAGSSSVDFVFAAGTGAWAKVYVNGSNSPLATWTIRGAEVRTLTRSWSTSDTIQIKLWEGTELDRVAFSSGGTAPAPAPVAPPTTATPTTSPPTTAPPTTAPPTTTPPETGGHGEHGGHGGHGGVADGFPADHDAYYRFLQEASTTARDRVARNIQLVPNGPANAAGVVRCGGSGGARCYGELPGWEGHTFRYPLETGNPYADTPSDQLDIADYIVDGRQRYSQIQGKVTDGGRFHEVCQFSHLAYDDPIVFPGQPGATHLHMFFGNTRTNAFSTADSILNEGGSTCGKGELNRTAYWIPALFDGNHNVIVPEEFMVYYQNSRTENQDVVLPDDLRFVHGEAHAPQPQQMVDPNAPNEKLIFFSCGWYAGRNTQNVIPNCDNDGFLEMSIRFPYCWNGREDSGDHKSHVVYPSESRGGYWKGDSCPASHPIELPRIRYRVFFDVRDFTTSTTQAYLSSDVDHMTGQVKQGGTTWHGDWFGGWHRETADILVENCIHPDRVNCDQQNLGDPSGRRFAYPTKVGGRFSPEQVLESCPLRSSFDGRPWSVAYCTMG